MQVFEVARHTKLWNYDQERWSSLVTGWLERRAQSVQRLGDEAAIVG